MKQKLQEYALLAEIISAVAIIASLLFVGVQLKQNDKTNQVSAYQALTSESIDSLYQTVLDRDVATLFAAGQAGDELDEIDTLRINLWFLALIRQSELAYVQFENGFIEESQLQILVSGLSRNWNSPYMQLVWRRSPKNEAFSEYIENWLGPSN